MVVEKIDIPEELKALNPETQKKPIVIGADAYMIYPLTEGQVEKMTKLISDIISDIFTDDVICPECNKVYKGVLNKQKKCTKCKGKGDLESLQKSPIEALTYEDRAMKFIEELLEIKVDEIKEHITIPQFKHLVSVIYEQNFKEEGVLPEESRKNFKALLGWVGLGAQMGPIRAEVEKESSTSEKFTNPSRTSMDSKENTSEENGE